MNILILGGTGVMGHYLCQILADAGHSIFVTSRSDRKNGNGVTYIRGNAHDKSFIEVLLQEKRWDVIVDFMKYSTEEFAGRASMMLDSAKQYIYLSSARVYADSQTAITEDSPLLIDVCQDKEYLATDEYALKKSRQEQILMNSKKNNWTIVRPYVTFGENRLQLSALEKEYWLYRALKGRTIVFSKDLAEKMTVITYGHDVANTIATIIKERDLVLEQVFNITTNETHTWEEILETYLNVLEQHLKVRPKVLILPKWEPFMGGNKYQVKCDRLYNRYFDNSKISNFTDTTKFKPTIPTISSCLVEFINNPQFKKINWGSEAMKDRLTGEWAGFKEIAGIGNKVKYCIIRLGLCKNVKFKE